MTQRDSNPSDAEFEQWLLDSGRSETAPPELTERAWKRFVKASGPIAAGALGVAALNELGARASLAKWAWLGVGVALGSAGTLALVERTPVVEPHVAATPRATAKTMTDAPREQTLPLEASVTAPATASQAAPPGPQPPLRAHPPGAQPSLRAPARLALPPSRGIQRAPAAAERPAHGSSLAAEVRALDAVRKQIEAGHSDRALAAVTAFHRDFPRAQLAADAEGLAIEALLALQEHSAAASRARRFLHDYPRDPHASRFEPLAAER